MEDVVFYVDAKVLKHKPIEQLDQNGKSNSEEIENQDDTDEE